MKFIYTNAPDKAEFSADGQKFAMSNVYIFNMLRKALLIHLLHRLLDSKEYCGSREIIH